LLKKKPLECSGGERQRAAIVRQLLLKPKYLLLDEITSALDIEHIEIMARILLHLKKTTGIVVVTHMLHFAEKISDEIYFMEQGIIIEQ
jgi:ABC-type polar amino acid transport system ATPase subunit